MLEEMVVNKDGRPTETSSTMQGVSSPSHPDLGINHTQSSHWQKRLHHSPIARRSHPANTMT